MGALALALVALASFAGLAPGVSAPTSQSDGYREFHLFGEVLSIVRSDYVEKPDDTKLIEGAINGMLAALDPHSSYMNAKQFREMQVETRGEFGGLGLEVTMEKGVIKVVAPIEDSPAAKAGLQSGDQIIALDKEHLQGLTLQEAVEKMRGPVNAPITLTVMRKGRDDPFDVKMIRDVIRIRPVKYNAEGDVGYIHITSFNEQTTADLQEAVEHLKKEIGPKLTGYIMDLRNNPGGLLDQAISVSDDFLNQGAIGSPRGVTRGRPARRCAAGRHHRRQEARGPGQWRLGLGLGDRGGRAPGSPQGDHHRHAILRQGLGADHHSARHERCAPTDDGPLLHPVRPLHSGQRHRTR